MKILLLIYVCIFLYSPVFSQENTSQTVTTTGKPTNRIRISLSSGIGYMTASVKEEKKQLVDMGFVSDEVDKYYKNVRLSYPVIADIHYLLSDFLGIGFNYSFFSSKGELEGIIDIGDMVHYINARISERMYISFAGVSFLYMQKLGIDEKWNFVCSMAPGMMIFRDETEFLNMPLLITGKAFGLNTSVGMEYFLSEGVSLGIDISYLMSSLHKIKVSNGDDTITQKLEKEDYQNISRLNFTAGIKFYF